MYSDQGRYIGYELGVGIVEVEWLGIPVPFRGVRVAIRAVCEILNAAVDLVTDVEAVSLGAMY